MSLDVEIFRNACRERMSANNFEVLNNAIIDTGALVAGGSLVSAYTGDIINDIDIYIHISRACELKDVLIRMKYKISSYSYVVPAYDQSFFRRNNILARFYFANRGGEPDIDLILISDSIPLRNVVANFDLSFCEIWYDGRTVEAVDPAGILAKRGVLKRDYVENLLVNFNKYTIDRMKKYIKRGFTITYENVNISNINVQIYKKRITSPEEWVVSKIYNYIIFNWTLLSRRHLLPANFVDIFRTRGTRPIETSFNIVCRCNMMQGYTLANLTAFITCLQVPEGRINALYKRIIFNYYYLTWPLEYKQYVTDVLGISIAELTDYCERANERFFDENSDDENLGDIDDNVVDTFEFEETLDIDENTIPNTTCNDLYMLDDDVNILEHLHKNDTFLFVNKGPDNVFDVLCFEKSYIEAIIADRNNNWFYECTGPFITRNGVQSNTRSMSSFNPIPYIKIPISNDGLNGFVPVVQIKKLLRSNAKIYYIYPFLDNDGTQKMVTHTSTWQNAYSRDRSYVSANHCQSGTSILVYTLKLCRDPVRCVKSLFAY